MKHRIPCLVPVGKVSDGIYYNSCNVENEYTMIKKVYLAIEITSNSFAPAYCKGDRILHENRFPELGERAVFTDGLKAYFRYFKMKGNDYFHRHKKCWMNFSGKRVNWFPAKNIHFYYPS